ncbi:hypothetical protein ACT17_23030 [Mycolicibacterium conceptionense]|uniref:Uncharacterized protein n=1 Tax=Mycolicibacterium conceptionense TaxID=451644 RepID=A0A0J8U371_9MYCO|nr:hypothetical protein [Mycolicibacterium conceptionense]KMV15966.1 hypothetical protein ACT17_23030 [Mycolicibacterium conceptionense]
MIPIPTPIILPSGSSGGRDPNAPEMAVASLVLTTVAAVLVGMRQWVYARTTDFVCTLDSLDVRRRGVDCVYRSLNDNSYDTVYGVSAMLAWVVFGTALLIGLLAGPFLASRRWVRSEWRLAMAMYTLLVAVILVMPSLGPEYLDPIRTALVVCWALSLITYSVTGFRSLRPESAA